MSTIIDLIERGYQVYQSVLPDAPCDFVAVKFDGPTPTIVKLVEAATGWKISTGELRCPKQSDKLGKCHELAVVFDKQVNYIQGSADPQLPSP